MANGRQYVGKDLRNIKLVIYGVSNVVFDLEVWTKCEFIHLMQSPDLEKWKRIDTPFEEDFRRDVIYWASGCSAGVGELAAGVALASEGL